MEMDLDSDDPDFIGPKPPKVAKKCDNITIKLNRHLWLKNLHLHNRRGKTTPAEMFRFCAATIQSGGGDLESFPLSAEGIRLKGIELDEATARTIRVGTKYLVTRCLKFDILLGQKTREYDYRQ